MGIKTKIKLIICIVLSILTIPFLTPIWEALGIVIGCFVDIILLYMLYTYIENKIS